jgi:putative flippase GtrA
MPKIATLTRQFITYGLVAALGLVVDFSIVVISKQFFGLYYLYAAVLGFCAGLIVTYFLSNVLVFGAPKDNPWKVFVMFAVIGVIGLGILTLIMWILSGLWGLNYIVSKALATVVVFIWNFSARRTLYRDQSSEIPYEL